MKKKTLNPEHNLTDDAKDIGFKTTRASLILLSSIVVPIPGFAGAVNQSLDIVWKSPAEKRLNNWISVIEEAVLNQESKIEKLQFKNLLEDEEFISLFFQTTQLAIKSHQQEKLNALKNSLINSVLSDLPFDIKTSLISKLEKLTLSHLKILSFIQHNQTLLTNTNDYEVVLKKFSENMNSTITSIEEFVFLFYDLSNERLINIGNM